MRWSNRHPRIDDALAEIAALADGSLPSRRRAAVEARIARSPDLALALERQRRVVAALNAASAPAPPELRARLEAQQRIEGVGFRLPSLPAPLAAAACLAAALALAIALPLLQSGGDGPTATQLARLSEVPAERHAPAVDVARPTTLRERVEGLPYPNLSEKFGWRASGVRSDTIDGRRATTVFYERDGKRIAYTILAGEAIEPPSGGASTEVDGLRLTSFAADGRTAVTWLREGHTCVLGGEGVSSEELVKLAAWTGKGTIPT